MQKLNRLVDGFMIRIFNASLPMATYNFACQVFFEEKQFIGHMDADLSLNMV